MAETEAERKDREEREAQAARQTALDKGKDTGAPTDRKSVV